MQNRVTKRYWSYRSRGFALPSVLIAVTIFFAILATSCAALTSTNRSMREEWFTSAARHAAESGLAQAKACIAKSNGTPQWTSAKPLRPGLSDNSCAGSETACTTIPKCYVVATGSLRSSYVVSVPEITANGDSYTISAEGTAAIISGGVVSDTRKVIIKQTGGRTEVKFSPDFFSSDSISPYNPLLNPGKSLFLSNDGQVYQAFSGWLTAPELVGGELAGKTITQLIALSAKISFIQTSSTQNVLTSDGKVYSWGTPQNCGIGGTTTAPAVVEGALAGKIVTKIAANVGTAWALTSDGALYAWGCNNEGQFGNGTTTSSSVPVPVTMTGVLAGKTITAIYPVGGANVIVLASDGTLYGWGSGNHRLNGNGSEGTVTLPSAVVTSGALAGKTIARVDWVRNSVFAIDTDGKVYVWGSNANNVLDATLSSFASILSPVAFGTSGALAGKKIVQVAGTKSGSVTDAMRAYALSSTGEIYGWGVEGPGGEPFAPMAIRAPSGVSFKKICANNSNVYAVSTTGVIYSSAGNRTSSFTQLDVPDLPASDRIVDIACLDNGFYAISTEGRLYAQISDSGSVLASLPPITWQLDGIVH